MAIHNCKEIGENLQKIMTRLMANDNLVKLLYYTDDNPLSKQDLTTEQKQTEIFNKLIKIVPYIKQPEAAKSVISIRVDSSRLNNNSEFTNVAIVIEVFVPWDSWIIADSNLRPFAIMGEIQKSLNDKTINGLGKMTGGAFDYSFGTNEISCYAASYMITEYV